MWNVLVTRLDDYLDPASISNINSIDFDYYCTNENWKTTNKTKDCTLRLAMYYCLFRLPWDSPFSCLILVPPNSILKFDSAFLFTENRYQKLHPIRMILNFQSSFLFVKKDFFFGLNIVDLTIKNIHFKYSPDDSWIGNNLPRIDFVKLRQLKLCNVEFEQIVLSVSGSDQVSIIDSFIGYTYAERALNFNNIENVTVFNTTFQNNTQGAAVFKKCTLVTIRYSKFINNSASLGSAILLHKVNSSIIRYNRFSANIANRAGTIYWIYNSYISAPFVNDNAWIDNFARYYGNKTASSFCEDQCLKVSPDSIYYSDYTNSSLPSAISVSIVDYYGSVISYYNDRAKVYADRALSKCSAVLRNSKFENDAVVLNSTSNAKVLSFLLREGRGSFTNVGLPSGYMLIRIEIWLSIPFDIGDLDYRNQMFSSNINVSFRNCMQGEIFDLISVTQSSCSKCTDGYSLSKNHDFNSVSTKCLRCPEEADYCSGSQIYLKRGYWRPNNNSLDIYRCKSTESCTGGNTTSQDGCFPGQTGPLCAVCEDNHFRAPDLQCQSCAGNTTSLLISGGILIVIAAILALVYSRLNESTKEILNDDFISTIFSKIVASYQIILLGLGNTSSFGSLNLFAKFVGIFKIVNLDFASLLSLQCYVNYNYYSSLKFYLLFTAAISAFIISMAYFSQLATNRNRYYSMLVSLLYFLIPLVTSISLQIFKCTEVESRSYLIADLTIACHNNDYKFYMVFVYLGLFFSLGFFPFSFWYILYTRRHLIANHKVMQTYLKLLQNPLFNMKISRYYELLPPFESVHARYKQLYWWFDVYNLCFGLFLSSIVGSLVDDEKIVLIISIAVIVLHYVLEGKLNPYKYDLDNSFSYMSTFQIFIAYLCTYIRMNNTLGDDDSRYIYVDICLVAINVFVIFLAIFYLYIHFKRNKIDVAQIEAVDSEQNEVSCNYNYQELNNLFVDDDEYGCFFIDKHPWRLGTLDKVSDVDLLTVMGTLFFRLAPRGTYSGLKQRREYLGSISHALYIQEMVPAFIIDHTGNSRGSLTVFVKERDPDDDRHVMKMIFEGKIQSIFPNIIDHIMRKIKRRNIAVSPKIMSVVESFDFDDLPRVDEIMERLQKEPTDVEVYGTMNDSEFISHCEHLIFNANRIKEMHNFAVDDIGYRI
jgi:hypothetical protein